MSIDANIEKYLFDPENPKQCKSYQLFLSIAKKDPLIYVSSDFITIDYEKEIVKNDFNGELWDKPDNYESLNVLEKVALYKELLSEKDYYNFIDTLEINKDKFSYKKMFHQFFDIDMDIMSNVKSSKVEYSSTLLKRKLQYPLRYRTAYQGINANIYGSKILFDNNYFKYLSGTKELCDVASVLVTHIDNKEVFSKYSVHKNLKPLFLKSMSDIKLLLNVLQEDLKKQKNESLPIEDVSPMSSIKIENFYSIKNMLLEDLGDKKEIYVVGENGDGKTLFLQALALGLKGVDEGDVFDLVKSQKEYNLKIVDLKNNSYSAQEKRYKNFFAYGANRNNNCQMKVDETGYLTLFNSSLDLKNPIDWLKYLDHSEKAEKLGVVSVAKAKILLQELLESDVMISIEPDLVTFEEKGSIVSFEQLSAGYKGVITIVADLLVRLSENQSYVEKIEDFQGIVVIDEVELHLHPKWKYSFVEKLRKIFPKIQFVMTTHSPTVILGASKEAVFYKIYKEEGEVKISNQMVNEGYTNNSLVSSPLFDLKTISSRDFQKSVSSDDYIYAKIHETIARKIESESIEDGEKISKLIDEELAKL